MTRKVGDSDQDSCAHCRILNNKKIEDKNITREYEAIHLE